jgi:glycogen operon protein
MGRTVLPGKPYPQGATWDGMGTNFAIYSENAEFVELCLFKDIDDREPETHRLTELTANVWHIYLVGVKAGHLYGYRVHGLYDPDRGLRFNGTKLLIDPYAKAIAGQVNWEAPVFGYKLGDPGEDYAKCESDSAWGMPKCVVTTPLFEWENDRPPLTRLDESIIYEVHVKGFTKNMPEVPPELRGTYAGLASPPAIAYLRKLGITAVELLPVHDFLQDKILLEKGLRNYWGYNTTNFFSPYAAYSGAGDRGEQVAEFKAMVRALHAANIEVILDVVYNHTSEGNHLGPTLSFKGVDNTTYYRSVVDQPRYYMDYTGTGNTLNARHPQVLKLIMDSLRYWVTEMHVDGFRFDLASALAREFHDVDRLSSFFDVINQDPVVSQVKLIAEPWDVGEGGYQVGNFPPLWAEWNGKYRDVVRRYWKGDEGVLSELGYRLTGSSDLYQRDGRRPSASINFITAHDGLTLHDLVSYNDKHNEANGENNADGANDNESWNHGAEGPTDDSGIIELRERQKRNFMATLLLSHGVPMICGGDEIGRTQGGNNNGYCQDNEISWYDWNIDETRQQMLAFTRRLIELRREHPNLRRQKFFQGRRIDPRAAMDLDVEGRHIQDIAWIRPDGEEMTEEEWGLGWVRCLGLQLSGKLLDHLDTLGQRLQDHTFLMMFNPHWEPIDFYMPAIHGEEAWQLVLDTRTADQQSEPVVVQAGAPYQMVQRSLAVFVELEPTRTATTPMP